MSKKTPTRAQQVQTALTLIGKLFVEEMDAGQDDGTNWHLRYLQEQKDHRDNLNEANRIADAWKADNAQLEEQLAAVKEVTPYRKNLFDEINRLKCDIRDLETTLSARNQGLLGWQKTADERTKRITELEHERDSWAQRFKGLDADMRGTMTTLRGLESEIEQYKKTDAYIRAQLDLKTKAAAYLGKLHDAHVDTIRALEDKVKAFESVIAHMTQKGS